MSEGLRSSGLLRTLRQLMPAAEFAVTHEQPWHSVTFSGVQARISMTPHAEICSASVIDFKAKLPYVEFHLPGQLVADIGVSGESNSENQLKLTIDALLIDD